MGGRGARAGQNPQEDARPRYPPQLLRRFDVVFAPPSTAKNCSIRQVDAAHIGKMVQIEGVVTKATAVKPYIQVATYACDACGHEIYQEITGPSFNPRVMCESNDCKVNRRKGRLHLQTRGSKFVKYQELRVQELSSSVPTGHIPRSLTVHAYGDNTRIALPGNHVTIAGIFLPIPHTGMRKLNAGLLTDTFLLAMVRAGAGLAPRVGRGR